MIGAMSLKANSVTQARMSKSRWSTRASTTTTRAWAGTATPSATATLFPTGRVIMGWDFVGDAYNADSTSPSYNPVPVPDPYPDDCNGHGTHVAGIVGANGAVKGVAPDVTFGAYRVFGCEGSTTADIMIAAMERALADDMQVLNMSIGSAFQWPGVPERPGRRPAGEQGCGGGGLDRQQRHQRPLRRQRTRRWQEGDRRGVVRQHLRVAVGVFGVARQQARWLQPCHGRLPCARQGPSRWPGLRT